MKIDSLVVAVPERPALGHVGGSIRFLPSLLLISRLENEDRVSDNGAHLSLILPAALLLECFGRRTTLFNFQGPYLGELTERSGLTNYEYGGFGQHAVTELTMRAQADLDHGIFHLALAGGLSPWRQNIDHWEVPRPLTKFDANVAFPIAEAGSVFHGKDDEMQSAVEKRLERFVAN